MRLCPHCFSISSENSDISVMPYCKAVWKIYLLKLILESNFALIEYIYVHPNAISYGHSALTFITQVRANVYFKSSILKLIDCVKTVTLFLVIIACIICNYFIFMYKGKNACEIVNFICVFSYLKLVYKKRLRRSLAPLASLHYK